MLTHILLAALTLVIPGQAQETAGALQFETWKRDAVYRDYQILYSAYAGGSSWDLTLILDHDSNTDRWQEIEKRMPGGLRQDALAMAAPQSSSLADLVAHAEAVKRDSSKATTCWRPTSPFRPIKTRLRLVLGLLAAPLVA
jgi:hypothetical protein